MFQQFVLLFEFCTQIILNDNTFVGNDAELYETEGIVRTRFIIHETGSSVGYSVRSKLNYFKVKSAQMYDGFTHALALVDVKIECVKQANKVIKIENYSIGETETVVREICKHTLTITNIEKDYYKILTRFSRDSHENLTKFVLIMSHR
jgi:hypothetical protein